MNRYTKILAVLTVTCAVGLASAQVTQPLSPGSAMSAPLPARATAVGVGAGSNTATATNETDTPSALSSEDHA